MESLWIYDGESNLVEYVRIHFCQECNPPKQASTSNNYYSRHEKRFIDVSTSFPSSSTSEICYGYHFSWSESYVKFYLRGSFATHHWRDFRKYLMEQTGADGELVWENQYTCRYDKELQNYEEIVEGFKTLSSLIDPIILEYLSIRLERQKMLAFGDGKPFVYDSVAHLSFETRPIKYLDFSLFKIPDYQRTYKWQRSNVNQLINDVLEYGSTTYRLGSLVLHNGDIVDGQQRIVTLALILHQMMLDEDIRSHTEYQGLFDSVVGFWKRTSYKNREALNNIILNLDVIRNRASELDYSFFQKLVENCEFVVIQVPTIQEAFQFFDSQNSRGKDLEAHDLLKAFHLREIEEGKFTEHDSINIAEWEQAHSDLIPLFLCLYRIRKWSKGESARFFTKNDVGEFKGLSLSKPKSTLLPLYNPSYFLNKLFAEFYDPGAVSSGKEEFPFQLTGHVINGTRFFDMILHYNKLYGCITDRYWTGYGEVSKDILLLLDTYDGVTRVGDEYVRNIFDALVLFYVDRFGTVEIDKAIEKFFLYAYSIRITQYRVSLATIDNEMSNGRMFRLMRESVSPYDVLNEYVPSVENSALAPNCSAQLVDRFEDLKKIRHE